MVVMRSDCDRGLNSVFSDFRKPSLRRELRFCLSLTYSESFATSVADRRLGWSGTVSLARPDVTSSVEDLTDEGGESSVLDGETVDKETNAGLKFCSVVKSIRSVTKTGRAVQYLRLSNPYS